MDYKIQTVHNAADDLPLCKEIVELTRPVRKTYPEYGKWLEEKFFPGLKDGSRIIIAAKDETGRLAGTILLKKTAEEKKICCLFVSKCKNFSACTILNFLTAKTAHTRRTGQNTILTTKPRKF